jgi:hypothetical protein
MSSSILEVIRINHETSDALELAVAYELKQKLSGVRSFCIISLSKVIIMFKFSSKSQKSGSSTELKKLLTKL